MNSVYVMMAKNRASPITFATEMSSLMKWIYNYENGRCSDVTLYNGKFTVNISMEKGKQVFQVTSSMDRTKAQIVADPILDLDVKSFSSCLNKVIRESHKIQSLGWNVLTQAKIDGEKLIVSFGKEKEKRKQECLIF